MLFFAVIVGLLGGAALGVVIALLVLRVSRADAGRHSHEAVAAAVEQLSLERDATMDALREQLDAERRQLGIDRERALQATVDTVLRVADDKLGSRTALASQDLQLRNEAIGQQVAGMNDELRRVRELVAQLQKEKAEQHGQFVHGLDQAMRASNALTDTTQGLREVLSNSRARGQWGERMADDVLRTAGFVEGVNYRRQQTLKGGSRPDFTFVLPHDRLLHMDVKFPLDNYLKVLDAGNEAGRQTATRAFLKDVRARIRELNGRAYTDPDTTVGYVLLFIPNESVYGFVHEHDAGLLDDALAQQVVLCSPCTLFAVLGVVRQAVDNFLVERTGVEILECLAGFTAQWQAFSAGLDKLGAQFTTAQRTFDELAGTRRRQMQKHLDRVERLRTSRSLDDLDDCGDSDEVDGLAEVAPFVSPTDGAGVRTAGAPAPGAAVAARSATTMVTSAVEVVVEPAEPVHDLVDVAERHKRAERAERLRRVEPASRTDAGELGDEGEAPDEGEPLWLDEGVGEDDAVPFVMTSGPARRGPVSAATIADDGLAASIRAHPASSRRIPRRRPLARQ